jgi:hypothetical protein
MSVSEQVIQIAEESKNDPIIITRFKAWIRKYAKELVLDKHKMNFEAMCSHWYNNLS